MHFTYAPARRDSLRQGDLIKRTTAVDSLLEQVHPHYHKSTDYRFLAVLTQSCDLQLRNGECSSRYVTLAAVRPLRRALERESEALLYYPVEKRFRFADANRRQKLEQFLERLLNNNEPPYFFYYREPNLGLAEDHCAFLQLSIAVKAELHYHTLVEAKVLELKDSFQHKLGHLVGNIYSRIGTEDWRPDHCNDERWRELVRSPIEEATLPLWIEKEVHKKVVSELKRRSLEELTEADFRALLEKVEQERDARRREALEIVRTRMTEAGIAADVAERVATRLQSDAVFRSRLK